MLFNNTMVNKFDKHAKNSSKKREKEGEGKREKERDGSQHWQIETLFFCKYTPWAAGKKIARNYITNSNAAKLLMKCGNDKTAAHQRYIVANNFQRTFVIIFKPKIKYPSKKVCTRGHSQKPEATISLFLNPTR